MNETRFNELLVKEASKTLTPLQAAELDLLRKLQDNNAAQNAEQAQAATVEEETNIESEPVVETEPEMEVEPESEPEQVQAPTVIEGEIGEDVPASDSGDATLN